MLGIIGGMGPLADVTFFKLLHYNTLSESDSGYVPVLYDGNCLRPDRSSFLTEKSRLSPFESLRFSLKLLERNGADVIVMPCNTAHFWFNRLYRTKKRKTRLISIVHEVCAACQRNDLRRVCVLSTAGTRKKDIYGDCAFKMGIDLIYPEKELCQKISELIKRIKKGENATLTELEPHLKQLDCDGFILACTELSVALDRTREPSFTYIDSLSTLVSASLNACGVRHKPIPFT